MNEFARIAVAASALLLAGGAAAQMNKCASAAGKITYTGLPCGNLGLKDAGEIKDKMNSAPAQKVYVPPPAPALRVPAADTGAAAKPEDDDKRCFTVKTAKGSSTRCNGKPEE